MLTQLPVLSPNLRVARLFREPLHLAVSHDHRLARQASAAENDLAGETLLALSGGFSLHDQIVDLARRSGATLRQDYEGSSLDALRQMVSMNMGLTLLPALYAHSEVTMPGGDVALVAFRRGRLTRSIGMVTRTATRPTPALAAFRDAVHAVVSSDFASVLVPEHAGGRGR